MSANEEECKLVFCACGHGVYRVVLEHAIKGLLIVWQDAHNPLRPLVHDCPRCGRAMEDSR